MSILLLLSFFVIRCLAAVSWSATPFNPASVPLAVRSPYLSAWLNQGSGTALNADWPRFWTGSVRSVGLCHITTFSRLEQILGWAGYVKVDGTTYNFLGTPGVPGTNALKAVQKSLTVRIRSEGTQRMVTDASQFTATQSIFVMTAGPVDLTVTFLSPVEVCSLSSRPGLELIGTWQPTDLVKQSLPFSYLALSAAPNDGKVHSVQLYSDISAEWVTGDNSLSANWTTAVGDVVTHQVQLVNQQPFVEASDHIQRKLVASRNMLTN